MIKEKTMSNLREDLANHMAQAWHGPDAAPEHINDDVKSTIKLMEGYAIGKSKRLTGSTGI